MVSGLSAEQGWNQYAWSGIHRLWIPSINLREHGANISACREAAASRALAVDILW